ncbi:hypothetical protein [Cellulomonas alba]|uniref:Uncharacterized protein n=1 Tax=Cellulomonas alba TaxID=3053467 RepID=A0ABT7SBG0_9CELL|nr:hypothetical protein [Cellulomonas alba]MDM7853520.1 hypothetical protein [Cellulomonas alba]
MHGWVDGILFRAATRRTKFLGLPVMNPGTRREVTVGRSLTGRPGYRMRAFGPNHQIGFSRLGVRGELWLAAGDGVFVSCSSSPRGGDAIESSVRDGLQHAVRVHGASLVEDVSATTLAGRASQRYVLHVPSASGREFRAVERVFARGRWRYVVGVLGPTAAPEEAWARAEQMLASWRWERPDPREVAP